jgi:hypothetical protein
MLQLTLTFHPNTDPPKPKKGRPSKHITAAEITEAMNYYFTQNNTEKQRIHLKLGDMKIKHSLNIFRTDLGKQGAILRCKCPFHGRVNLIYNWHGTAAGVRIACLVSGCLWTTHFEPMIYGVTSELNEQSEFNENE